LSTKNFESNQLIKQELEQLGFGLKFLTFEIKKNYFYLLKFHFNSS